MPSASVSTATAVKPGFFSSWRKANLRSFISWRVNGRSWPDEHDTKTDVVVASLRLEPQSKGGAARPALVGPTAPSTHSRHSSSRVQVRDHTSGQFQMVPVPAPLEDVAMHVVQPPGVGRVAADFRRPIKRWARFGSVVGLSLEVRLFAAELV